MAIAVKTNAEACVQRRPYDPDAFVQRPKKQRDRWQRPRRATRGAMCEEQVSVTSGVGWDCRRFIPGGHDDSLWFGDHSANLPKNGVSSKFDPLRPASCSCSKAGIFGTHEFAICPRNVSSILCCPAGLAKARGSRLPKGAACHAKLRDGDFDWMSARVWIFDLQPPYAAGVKDTGFYVAGRAVDRALRRWRAGQAELLDWHLAFVSELYLDGVVFDLGTDQGYRTGGLGQTSERSRHQK